MQHSSVFALIAALPLIWLLFSLTILRLRLHLAALAALGFACCLALGPWRAGGSLVFFSAVQGALFGLWPVVWVVMAALFSYTVLTRSGMRARIENALANGSPSPAAQVLLVAFCFGAFLEGTAGFGTPLVIPTGILMGLGFSPMLAGVACLVANTVPVAWAGLGIPVITLAKVAGLDLAAVARVVALQSLPLSLVVPLALVWLVRHRCAPSPISPWRDYTLAGCIGLVYSLAQFAVVRFIGPELPAIAAGLSSGGILLLLATKGRRGEARRSGPLFGGLQAWSPYLILMGLILATRLWPAVRRALTGPGFLYAIDLPGVDSVTLDLLYSPGTLLFLAALLGGLIQGMKPRGLALACLEAGRKTAPTALTIVALVAMAKVMSYGGMIGTLTRGLTGATGRFFPLLSPLLGALGTFLAGTDTASNILFGPLQAAAAARLAVSPAWLAGANAVGGAVGKLISPQSLAAAALGMGTTGKENSLLKATLPWCALFAVLLALVVWFLA